MVSVREAINLLVAMNVIMASQAPSVMADGGLRAWCFAGAIGGGLVSVIFKPPKTARQAAMKWLGSTILAVGLTPLIMLRLKIAFTEDMVIGMSLIVAILAWLIVSMLLQGGPLLFSRVFPVAPPPPEEEKEKPDA